MRDKIKQFSVFDVQGDRFKAGSSEEYQRESERLTNLIHDAKISMEMEVICSPQYYKQLLSWLELVVNKEIRMKDILSKGQYSEVELNSKKLALIAFIKLLKQTLKQPNKKSKKELYRRFYLIKLRRDSVENLKNGIISRRIKCSNLLYRKVIRLNNLIEESCGKIAGMYMPYAINLANKKGMRYDEEGNMIGSFVDDYIQAGLIGIYEAAKRFDPKKNISFTTYAWYWMVQGFGNVVDQSEIIRFPKNVKRLKNKIMRRNSKFGNSTNANELSLFLNQTESSVQRALECRKTLSLEGPSLNDEGEEEMVADLSDGHNVEEDVCSINRHDVIAGIIDKTLDLRERILICNRFGLNGCDEHTYSEIAQYMQMTTEGVRQATKNAIKKIIPEIVSSFGGEYGEKDTEKVLKMYSKGRE